LRTKTLPTLFPRRAWPSTCQRGYKLPRLKLVTFSTSQDNFITRFTTSHLTPWQLLVEWNGLGNPKKRRKRLLLRTWVSGSELLESILSRFLLSLMLLSPKELSFWLRSSLFLTHRTQVAREKTALRKFKILLRF
jgi:hypothetical protein